MGHTVRYTKRATCQALTTPRLAPVALLPNLPLVDALNLAPHADEIFFQLVEHRLPLPHVEQHVRLRLRLEALHL